MKDIKHLLTLLALTFTVSVVSSCNCGDDDVIVVNGIGGFYFFVNETTNDSIDNYDAKQGKPLEAHNGDSLNLAFKSSLPEGASIMRCRMTFVLPDGSKHVVEDSNDKDMSYGFVLTNMSKGRKTFLIIPELLDKKITYTGNDTIVLFKLLVTE